MFIKHLFGYLLYVLRYMLNTPKLFVKGRVLHDITSPVLAQKNTIKQDKYLDISNYLHPKHTMINKSGLKQMYTFVQIV